MCNITGLRIKNYITPHHKPVSTSIMPGACITPGTPSDTNNLSVFLEQLHVEDDFFENVDMMFHLKLCFYY